jgi:hypothetical protein
MVMMWSFLVNEYHHPCMFFSREHTGSGFKDYCRKKIIVRSLRCPCGVSTTRALEEVTMKMSARYGYYTRGILSGSF